MSLDKTNIYFTAFGAAVPGGFLIDFRHAATGLVVSMTEALLIQDLPEGLTLRSHPGLPGKAAWQPTDHLLRVSITLRRAGFAASAEEIQKPWDVPALPEPKSPEPKMIELSPGIYMQVGGQQTVEVEPVLRENLVFNLKSRTDGGRVITEVAFGQVYPEYPEDMPEEVSQHDLEAGGHWDDVCKVIGSGQTDKWRFSCARSFEETIAGLEALGITRDERVFLWFDPSELAFGISDPENPEHDLTEDDPQMWIFILPKDEKAPYFDDLRGNHLPEEPDYFEDNLCENTFSIKKGANRAAVIADMQARGYTYQPEYDGAAGG